MTPRRRPTAPGRRSAALTYGALAAVVSLACTAALTAATAEEMYVEALARERTIRATLVRADATPGLLADVRAVAGAYEAIVRAFPRSGYSDNALWQAGCLLLDAFDRFGQTRDRDQGTRLLRLLTSEYPSSSLLKDVPSRLARAQTPRARASTATVTNIRREVLPDAVRVTIVLDQEVGFHDERLDNPERVFVDLPARAASSLLDQTLRFDGDTAPVRQIRIGRHPNNMTRVVLEAAGIASYSVYPLYGPFRLVIDCVRQDAALVVAADPPRPTLAAAAGEAPDAAGEPDAVPEPRPAAGAAGREPPAPADRPAPARAAAPAPAAPAAPLPGPVATAAPPRNGDGNYSMARQLGLNVSRVVIDPGHGGHDPGATGGSITEAELVLDVALRMEKLLQNVPGIEVVLTRRTDEYVPLQERTAIANREGADLFLSIHANASRNTAASGVETYFLNFATNMSAAAVAARENAASGQAMGALPDFLKAIALNNKLAESRDFAGEVQRSMIEWLRRSNRSVKNLGVKQAPFVVLIGAAMPSVLAEVSFLTNAQEARLLRSTSYRQRIAEALVQAIRTYQSSLKTTATVAKQ